jgi:hypothetical protein
MTPPPVEPTASEPAEVTGKVEKALALLSTVGASTIEIACEGLALENGLLEAEGKGSATASFTGCMTWLNGNLANNCKPKSPGAETGTIVTNPLVGVLKSHTLEGGAKEGLLELTPKTGTSFVLAELGALCGAGNKFDVTGTLFARDSGGELEVEAQTHLLEASAALGGVKFGSNAATLDGSVGLDVVEHGLWSGLGATPKWMTPPPVEPTASEPAEVTGKVEKALALLSTVGASTIEIACEGLALENGLLEAEGKGSATASFTGCMTWLNGNLANNCKPKSPGAETGTIVTNPLVGVLKSHTLEGGAKEGLLELTPKTGTSFVLAELGALCGAGNKFDVTGTLFARDSGGELEVEAQTHLLEASAALGGVKFGSNAATLDGSVRLDLVEGGSWSGLGE